MLPYRFEGILFFQFPPVEQSKTLKRSFPDLPFFTWIVHFRDSTPSPVKFKRQSLTPVTAFKFLFLGEVRFRVVNPAIEKLYFLTAPQFFLPTPGRL